MNRALAAALAAAALAGCGYSTGQLVSPGYRTIAVPVFDNTTPAEIPPTVPTPSLHAAPPNLTALSIAFTATEPASFEC